MDKIDTGQLKTIVIDDAAAPPALENGDEALLFKSLPVKPRGDRYKFIRSIGFGGMKGVLLVRDRGIVAQRLVPAQFVGPIGGALALVLMAKVSSSGFTDAGGPADWLLIGLVFGLGLLGTMVLVYTAIGWVKGRPAARG